MAQASPQVPPPLLASVSFDGFGLGGAIPCPVPGVVGAPFPGAVAANLTILRIPGELPLPVLIPALLLARCGRTRSLPRVKTRWGELLLAERATPLLIPSESLRLLQRKLQLEKKKALSLVGL